MIALMDVHLSRAPRTVRNRDADHERLLMFRGGLPVPERRDKTACQALEDSAPQDSLIARAPKLT